MKLTKRLGLKFLAVAFVGLCSNAYAESDVELDLQYASFKGMEFGVATTGFVKTRTGSCVFNEAEGKLVVTSETKNFGTVTTSLNLGALAQSSTPMGVAVVDTYITRDEEETATVNVLKTLEGETKKVIFELKRNGFPLFATKAKFVCQN